MNLGGTLVLLILDVEHCRLNRIGFLVVGHEKKRRRRIGGNTEAFAEFALVILVEKSAAVDEDQEIRAARVVKFSDLRISPRRSIPCHMARQIRPRGKPEQ